MLKQISVKTLTEILQDPRPTSFRHLTLMNHERDCLAR